jgi:hypothetical protein
MARCFYQTCGFNERISDEKTYFVKFEKGTEDYARKTPNYDLSFVLVRKFALAFKLNGDIKPTTPFLFFLPENEFTGESAKSLGELAEKIKEVDLKSLEYHFYRRDFEKWILFSFGEVELSQDLANLREKNPFGETLRIQLYSAISKRLKAPEAITP